MVKKIIVLLIIFSLPFIGFYIWKNFVYQITEMDAITAIEKVSEVQQWRKLISAGVGGSGVGQKGSPHIDVESSDVHFFFIHTYELRGGHTMTFHRYKVSKKNSEVTKIQ